MTRHLRFAATAAIAVALNVLAFLPPLVWGGGWNPAHEPAALAFLALGALWLVAEGYAVHVARDGAHAPNPAGALPWVSASAVFAVLWLALYDRGSFLPVDAALGAAVGGLLMVAGIVLRTRAVRTLGRCFLDAPAVLPDHELVVRGIYRRVRHPAELGTVCYVVGAVLLLGSGVALAAIVPLAGLVGWRIRREEEALSAWFPAEWEAYRRAVPALLPVPRRKRAGERAAPIPSGV
jgi:protein-S-isoprenylcysteine O-methyltransferase Ste14